jgi:hypothetical protein
LDPTNFGSKPLGSKPTLDQRKLGSSALTTRKSGSTTGKGKVEDTGFCAAMFTIFSFKLVYRLLIHRNGSWLLVEAVSRSRIGFG